MYDSIRSGIKCCKKFYFIKVSALQATNQTREEQRENEKKKFYYMYHPTFLNNAAVLIYMVKFDVSHTFSVKKKKTKQK